MKKTVCEISHMTKLSVWADRRKTVSQSEDVLHFCTSKIKLLKFRNAAENSLHFVHFNIYFNCATSLRNWQPAQSQRLIKMLVGLLKFFLQANEYLLLYKLISNFEDGPVDWNFHGEDCNCRTLVLLVKYKWALRVSVYLIFMSISWSVLLP